MLLSLSSEIEKKKKKEKWREVEITFWNKLIICKFVAWYRRKNNFVNV